MTVYKNIEPALHGSQSHEQIILCWQIDWLTHGQWFWLWDGCLLSNQWSGLCVWIIQQTDIVWNGRSIEVLVACLWVNCVLCRILDQLVWWGRWKKGEESLALFQQVQRRHALCILLEHPNVIKEPKKPASKTGARWPKWLVKKQKSRHWSNVHKIRLITAAKSLQVLFKRDKKH